MHINKLKIQNFKIFNSGTFDFNNDMNVIVGDNECGKSTLLEAIEICINFKYRGKPLNGELSTDFFNSACIARYLAGDKSQDTLPEIIIEAFLEGAPNLKGDNNSEKEDSPGIFIRFCFDEELSDSYATFIEDPETVSTIPVELYKIEWYSFAWNRLTYHNKEANCLFIDPSRLHPTFGRSKYINGIINSALDKNARSTLNLNYRQLKSKFDEDKDVAEINKKLDENNDITNKSLKITAELTSANSWESNLQLTVDDVSFSHIGKGEQDQIQIKLALQNKAQDYDIVLLEEPENHLSHINLVKLISYIEKKNTGKQIFLSTHSSYVLNKLSLDKLCLLSNRYSRLNDIDSSTVKLFKRLPGYDTLRIVLTQRPILVEGPSDELILKKIYLNKHGRMPEEDGIDIIVIRGIGFKKFLNISKKLQHPISIVKDNDGDYKKNILDWRTDYEGDKNIQVFSPENNEHSSLEPALIETNSATLENLDHFGRIILSKQTFNKYEAAGALKFKKEFLKKWFTGTASGSKKVDSAIRIFESQDEIIFPDYLIEAVFNGT